MNDTFMQKIKIGHRAKFRDMDNLFLQVFTPYFHFRCVARALFDRNFIHSADACFLVMACVGYSHAQLKTLSSLLSTHFRFGWRKFSKCACSELKTRTRSRPRIPIRRSQLTTRTGLCVDDINS